MRNVFQIVLIIIFCVYSTINLLAQDKIYTKGLANGFAWTAPLSISPPVYAKEESLLEGRAWRNYLSNIDTSINKRTFPLDCEEDIFNLEELNKTKPLEMDIIVKMIDKFYKNPENLIIPVLGAYCCSVKELAGVSEDEIETYRKKLLEYSKE